MFPGKWGGSCQTRNAFSTQWTLLKCLHLGLKPSLTHYRLSSTANSSMSISKTMYLNPKTTYLYVSQVRAGQRPFSAQKFIKFCEADRVTNNISNGNYPSGFPYCEKIRCPHPDINRWQVRRLPDCCSSSVQKITDSSETFAIGQRRELSASPTASVIMTPPAIRIYYLCFVDVAFNSTLWYNAMGYQL